MTVVASLSLLAIVAAACSSSPSPSSTGKSGGEAVKLLDEGIAAQNAGNYALAASKYSKVAAMEPHDVTAIYDLALVEQLQGDTSNAETHYRQALALKPNDVSALFNLAICVTKSDPVQAQSLYLQALTFAPNNAGIWLNLGFVLRSLHQTKQGNADLRKAERLDPSLASRLKGIKLRP